MPGVLSVPVQTIPIDDPKCVAQLWKWANSTASAGFRPGTAPLIVIQFLCGDGYKIYPFWDIQGRLATWLWPMLLVIFLIPISLSHSIDRAMAHVHVMGNPIDAMYSALVNLASLEEYYILCRDTPLDTDSQRLRKAAAIVLMVSESWERWADYEPQPSATNHNGTVTNNTRKTRVEEFFRWLQQSPEHQKVCEDTAENLSEFRARTIPQAIMGMVSFGVSISFAFSHALLGSVSNRTGHSIAFGMLFSGWVDLLFVTSFVPQFDQSMACERILEEFIDVPKPPPIHIPQRARSRAESWQLIHSPLMLFGHNHTFVTTATSERVTIERKTSIILYAVSVASPLISATCAISISYLNPTRGFDCRTLMQLIYLLVWVLSACATAIIRRIYRAAPDLQWRYTCFLNIPVLLAQMTFLILAYIGWFNNPECWSAAISLGSKAYIDIDPIPEIMRLVGMWWPIITGLTIFSHLLLVIGVRCRYHRAIKFYHYQPR